MKAQPRQRSPFLGPRVFLAESRRQDSAPAYLSPVAVAERLGVSLATVWRLARQGQLGARFKLGHRSTRFLASDVDAYVARCRVSTG